MPPRASRFCVFCTRNIMRNVTIVVLENCTDDDLDRIECQFKALRKREERNTAA
jgi:hypothetical protein